MTCWMCGHEKKGSHHLGCVRIAYPDVTQAQAIAAGLMAAPAGEEVPPEPNVEILKEGSMTTVPEMRTVEQCEVEGCETPKYSDSPRTKYCEEHRDPKNRKE